MVSSVTEGDIKKLRGAGYLASNIAHRLPAAGQIVPTTLRVWLHRILLVGLVPPSA